MGTHHTDALSIYTNHFHKQSQKYEAYISQKIPERPKCMDVHRKSENFKLSDAFSVLSFHLDIKTTWQSNGIHKTTAM